MTKIDVDLIQDILRDLETIRALQEEYRRREEALAGTPRYFRALPTGTREFLRGVALAEPDPYARRFMGVLPSLPWMAGAALGFAATSAVTGGAAAMLRAPLMATRIGTHLANVMRSSRVLSGAGMVMVREFTPAALQAAAGSALVFGEVDPARALREGALQAGFAVGTGVILGRGLRGFLKRQFGREVGRAAEEVASRTTGLTRVEVDLPEGQLGLFPEHRQVPLFRDIPPPRPTRPTQEPTQGAVGTLGRAAEQLDLFQRAEQLELFRSTTPPGAAPTPGGLGGSRAGVQDVSQSGRFLPVIGPRSDFTEGGAITLRGGVGEGLERRLEAPTEVTTTPRTLVPEPATPPTPPTPAAPLTREIAEAAGPKPLGKTIKVIKRFKKTALIEDERGRRKVTLGWLERMSKRGAKVVDEVETQAKVEAPTVETPKEFPQVPEEVSPRVEAETPVTDIRQEVIRAATEQEQEVGLLSKYIRDAVELWVDTGNKPAALNVLFKTRKFVEDYLSRSFGKAGRSDFVRLWLELTTGRAFSKEEVAKVLQAENVLSNPTARGWVELFRDSPDVLGAVAFGHPAWLPVRAPHLEADVTRHGLLHILMAGSTRVVKEGGKLVSRPIRIMTPEYLNEFQRRVGLIALERLRELGDARVDPQALSVIVKNALIRELGEEGFTMIGAPEKMVRAAELVAERGYEPLSTYTFRKVVEMSNIVGRILGRDPKELIDEALSVANRAYERIIEGAAELGPIEKSAMETIERIFPAAAERVGIAGEFYRGFKSLPRSVQEEVVESLMALEYLKKAIPDPLDGLADAITTLEYWSASNALREMVSVTRFMRVDPEGYLEFIAGRPYWRVERTLPRISAGEFFAGSVIEQLPTPTVPVPRHITAIDIPKSKAERGKILGHAVAISRRPRELAMGERERDISSVARSIAAALYRYVPKATRGTLREELPTASVREIAEALAHMKLDRRTKLRVLEKVVSGLERRGRKDLAEELKREGLAAIQRGGQ